LDNKSFDNSKKKNTKSFGEIFEGQNITHYKILKKLGEGGMGVVYKAEDTKLHRSVALKFLPTSLTSNKEAKERFVKEARAASGLDHPNICTIHEIDETEDGRMFISMGFYEGIILTEKITRGKIKIEEVIDIAIQTASGLAKAHQRGIIHRDIKPANLAVTEDELVKILDFGIAKLIGESKSTQENLQIGTIAHVSPEQIRGENFDHRTDIWSLGVVMYEMLTAKLPFEGEYDQAIIYSILNEEPTPIKEIRNDVPDELIEIVAKAMRKNQNERYQSSDEILKVLINCMESQRNSGKITGEPDSSERHRKLSAIMFTDMVGYSALAQKNEALSIELLETHRQLLRPIFNKHGGKEVETIGDAFFVEFRSALEAVSCAVEIQKTLHERNLKIDPDKKITLRIGLHVGDVVHIGKHVHGDGVNIAARLEPLSTPGGVCLSEDVVRQIKNKIELPVRNLGTQKLKNIETPFDVYCIEFPWEARRRPISKSSFTKTLLHKNALYSVLVLLAAIVIVFVWNNLQSPTINAFNNRIAVLPLVNISQSSEDDYFADGMTEELISQLAKISGLSVIARTSIMKYKNADMNINEIGKELNVGTILEGSVRKALDKARITVQLIDVNTQEHLWAEDYDRELNNIIELQSDIALKIANELKVQLLSTEKQQIEKRNTENAEAYHSYLLGRYQLNNRTPESLKNAINYFNTAVSLDPNYALAYVGLADCYTLISGAVYGYIPREEAIQKANDAIRKALEIDPTSAEAYNSLAYLKFRLEWDWKGADSNFKRAIELKPGYATAYEKYALYLAILGRYEEALPLMYRAFGLDPLSASVSTGIGRIYDFSRQYDNAMEQYNKTLEMNPDYVEAVFGLGLSYSHSKRYDQAISMLNSALELSNGRLIILAALGNAYARSGMIKEALTVRDNLIQQQKEKHISPFYFALIDAPLGNTEVALDSLYKSFDEHFGILVYLKASPFFENLKSEPRYNELIKMIGLED
jgi:serine/threonine protein kinase/TolB-like protein/Flp pilus assembly protein TadD